jgi:nitrous oxide reductase accessory protein NosL
MLRLVGIVALFVLAACGQTSGNAGPTPSPVIAQGSWTQNLTLTGELPGRITTIVADQGTQQTFCSGAKARSGDTWASTFYTTIDASGSEWQLSINVVNFRGPGTYATRDVQISLQAPDNSRAWLNQSADKVTFTMDRSQQSGTIDASLTSAYSGKKAAERIVGTWNCRG